MLADGRRMIMDLPLERMFQPANLPRASDRWGSARQCTQVGVGIESMSSSFPTLLHWVKTHEEAGDQGTVHWRHYSSKLGSNRIGVPRLIT